MLISDLKAVELDLGPGYTFQFTQNSAGEAVGGIETHPRPDTGEPCQGAITFRPNHQNERPSWAVEQWEPLTLSPSVLCRACGRHGFIREGKWREA